jgi:hypothetical protein
MTDDPKPKRNGRLFQPGQSGNPNGRKKGSRNKITQAIEAFLDGEGEALTRKAIELPLGRHHRPPPLPRPSRSAPQGPPCVL